MAIRLITPEFRVSYAKIWQPGQNDDGRDVYSLSMIFNKDDTSPSDIKKIQEAIKAAASEKWGSDQSKWPRQMKIPLRDADNEDRTNPNDPRYDENYVNAYFMNAKTFNKPGVIDKNVDPIIDENQFYSGCYARASVVFAAYDKGGGKGVGCYLNNIMKTKDGDRLGGCAPADVDFAAFKSEGDAAADGDIPF
jgi:hypothetical protein